MSIVVFKVETTGLPKRQKPLKDQAQPRMVQIAAVTLSPQWEEINMMHVVLKPDGWSSTADAMAVHQIPQRRNDIYGMSQKCALAFFIDMIRSVKEMASFMLPFDGFVVDVELAHVNAAPEAWQRGGLKRTNISELAAARWNTGNTMSLSDAHLAAVGETYAATHRALDDVRAAVRILKALREK